MSWIDDYNNRQMTGSLELTPIAKKGKQKDFWTDQISTVGGILGGIAGLPLGLLGAGGGSAAGSALGEALENAITGEDLTKNLAQEALLGGVLGAGPLRLGGAALGKVAPRAGQNLEQAGKNLLGTQANLTRAEARKLGATPADVMGDINARTGLTSLDQMAAVGSNVTGKNGVLSELTRNAIGNTPGVDIGDLRTVAEDLLINKAPLVAGSTRKNVVDQVKNSAVKSYGGSKGSLNPLANPYDAFDAARGFEGTAAKIRGNFTRSPADDQLADVYSSLGRSINDRLFAAPGVTEGLQAAKASARQSFEQLAKTAASRTEKNAYTRLANEIDNVQDIASLRSLQAPFVKLGKIDQATASAQSGAATQVGDNLQGLGRIVQRPTNLLALPLNAATPFVGGKLAAAGRGLQGAGSPQTAGGVVRNVAAGGLLLGDQASPSDAGAQQGEAYPNETPWLPDGTSGPLDQMTRQPVEQNPYPRENLIADMQRDPANAKKYLEQYQLYQELYGVNQKPVNSSVAGNITDMQKGLTTLDDLEAMISGEYTGGVLQGGLRQFNPLDSDFKTQQAMIDASRQIIGKAMEGGVLRKEDEEKYKRILPTMQDDPSVGLAKLRYIRGVLTQALNNYGSMTGGGVQPSTIEEALGY